MNICGDFLQLPPVSKDGLKSLTQDPKVLEEQHTAEADKIEDAAQRKRELTCPRIVRPRTSPHAHFIRSVEPEGGTPSSTSRAPSLSSSK